MARGVAFRWVLSRISALFIVAGLLVGVAAAQQTINGVTADGALYRFIVPSPWNGQLVVYAHGAVPAGAPIALPNNSLELQMFAALASQGFAVAMSSYAENGWAEKNGAQTTHQLLGLFTSQVSAPTRTHLAGTSLGGLIVVDLVERFPDQYDGALAFCGVVGGAHLQFQHEGDGRVLFDYFFPSVLPGDLLHTPNLDFSPGSPSFTAVASWASCFSFSPYIHIREVLDTPLSSVGGFGRADDEGHVTREWDAELL
jgi:hypothetical protein